MSEARGATEILTRESGGPDQGLGAGGRSGPPAFPAGDFGEGVSDVSLLAPPVLS